MKKIITTLLCLATGATLYAQSYSAPESVEYDAANNRYLVACKGTTKSIQQVVPGQSPTLFTSSVDNPYGIEILDNKLWVCDNGNVKSIKSFDLSTAALVDNITITGASFLNGITDDGDHFLFVSDFSAKKIYRVNTNTGAFNIMATLPGSAASPNGMWYDGANNRVLFVNWGSSAPVKAISLTDSSVTTVMTTAQGNCDGIGRDAAGNYFISSWSPQAVVKYNSSFGSPETVVSSVISNPADIYYNTANDTIAVPNSNNNTVTFHYAGSTVSMDEAKEKISVSVYPNPANEGTIFHYSLDASSKVELKIFNLEGKLQTVLANEIQQEGEHKISFNTSGFAAGNYFYSLQTDKKISKGSLVISGK